MSGTCDAPVVVAEIYDMKTSEFAAWKKDESLCSACLDKLIGAHLHLWLFKRKVQGPSPICTRRRSADGSSVDGWTPTQNCWYGYNCNTQVHKRHHAEAKNVRDPQFLSLIIVDGLTTKSIYVNRHDEARRIPVVGCMS
jgi:hypothetical protein